MRPLIMFATTLLMLMMSATGCATNNAALRGHTAAATMLDDFADDARELVLEQRQAKLDQAADDAHGLDVEIAVRDAAAVFDAGPKVNAVNAFIAAKDLYVRVVLAAASDEKPTWSQAKTMLGAVIDAYNTMRNTLGPKAMPPLPDVIAKLLTIAPRPAGPVEAVA